MTANVTEGRCTVEMTYSGRNLLSLVCIILVSALAFQVAPRWMPWQPGALREIGIHVQAHGHGCVKLHENMQYSARLEGDRATFKISMDTRKDRGDETGWPVRVYESSGDMPPEAFQTLARWLQDDWPHLRRVDERFSVGIEPEYSYSLEIADARRGETIAFFRYPSRRHWELMGRILTKSVVAQAIEKGEKAMKTRGLVEDGFAFHETYLPSGGVILSDLSAASKVGAAQLHDLLK